MSEQGLCLYHASCNDGFGAAVAVWMACGSRYEYIPVQYGEPPPDVSGREVIMVDFSYKRPVMQEMAMHAKSILVLDHHKSALEELAGAFPAAIDGHPLCTVDVKLDVEKSGAVLAWEFFHPEENVPPLLAHVQDRDLFLFRHPNTKVVGMALNSYEYDFGLWAQLMHDVSPLVRDGQAISRWYARQVDVFVSRPMRTNIGGYNVPIVNCPGQFVSEVGNRLAVGEPFAACYFDLPDGRVYSLRSVPNGVDVANVAQEFGGGGHQHAAGFKVVFDAQENTSWLSIKKSSGVAVSQ